MNARPEVPDDLEIKEVARSVRLLNFRRRLHPVEPLLSDQQLGELYGEAQEDDRALAEMGLADCQSALQKEDSA